jgi:diguanylate cyclase (GGDEF)-like protein
VATDVRKPTRSYRVLRIALAILIAGLAAMSVGLPFLAQSTKEAIKRTTTHDIAWNGANGRQEFQSLHLALLRFDKAAPETRYAQLALALDIVRARMETWRSGAFGLFIENNPDLTKHASNLETHFQTVATALSRPEAQDAVSDASRAMDKLMPSVRKLASAAYTHDAKEVSNNYKLLNFLQKTQQVTIAALIFFGFLLLAFLVWQNRKLQFANETERKIATENAFLASHDVLTGLPNRATINAVLEDLAASGKAGALIMIDLDGFKPINDVLGHAAGDALLISVAKRLEEFAIAMPGSVTGRLGGDEFVVLLADIDAESVAMAAGERLIESIQAPHELGSHHVQVNASAGVALTCPSGRCADLVARADLALAAAKAEGRGRAVMYADEMMRYATARAALEADLNASDFWHEIEPNFQPIIDLVSGSIVGCEALARWTHPLRGPVSPVDFIPVAEQSGRIIDIGEVMLTKACTAAMAMPEPIMISVNVSAAQLLRTNFLERVADSLVRSGLLAGRLKLEITESVTIGDRARTVWLLQELRTMGVSVSLDDFGTGYSSMAYLRDLPFDELKIDRSFVMSIEHDRQARAVVQTIIALAHNLDLRVVAEGIETYEQAQLLMAMGCARGQGYYFGRPGSAVVFAEALHTRNHPQRKRLIA